MPHVDQEERKRYLKAYKKSENGRRLTALYDRAKNANRRAEKLGAEGRITTADVRAVLHEEAVCAYCRTAERLTIDHRVPMAAGGPNVRENLVAACLTCNISKKNGDRPGRWSQKHDQCIRCGTTEKKHVSKGRCSRCYNAETRTERRAVLRANGISVHATGVSIRDLTTPQG